jgi:hypothetical protein
MRQSQEFDRGDAIVRRPVPVMSFAQPIFISGLVPAG